MAASDVPRAILWSMPVASASSGTTTAPPPTPKRPARKPEAAPMVTNEAYSESGRPLIGALSEAAATGFDENCATMRSLKGTMGATASMKTPRARESVFESSLEPNCAPRRAVNMPIDAMAAAATQSTWPSLEYASAPATPVAQTPTRDVPCAACCVMPKRVIMGIATKPPPMPASEPSAPASAPVAPMYMAAGGSGAASFAPPPIPRVSRGAAFQPRARGEEDAAVVGPARRKRRQPPRATANIPERR
mmetsp:Transcript_13407/g.46694  ORF Transcript_13407/g.46694 Transcript_13407/m.46694 type:complete len:249 (+) Transcript_13407:386-1132(+)